MDLNCVMKTFRCTNCNILFEAEGKAVEYLDFTFGPCKTWKADCPDCKTESSEYKKISQKKNSGFVPACGDTSQLAACGGNCCCE